MDTRLFRTYKEIFSEDFSFNECGLSDEELKKVFLFLDKDLNLDNDEYFHELIEGIDRQYPSVWGVVRKHLQKFKNSKDKSQKNYYAHTELYWRVRGWDEVSSIRNANKHKDIKRNNSTRKEFDNRKEKIYLLLNKYIKELCPSNTKVLDDFISYMNETYGDNSIPTRIIIMEWFKNYMKTPVGTQLNDRYWTIRGWSEEEAREKVIMLQRRRSKRCVEYWIDKCGDEDEARKLHSEYQRYVCSNKDYHGTVSKESVELFTEIAKRLPHHSLFFNDTEKYMITPIGRRWYDFTDETVSVIIEYNGIHWHSSDERKETDRIKKECAEKKGYKLYYIWDYEYKADKEGTISRIIKLLESGENV